MGPLMPSFTPPAPPGQSNPQRDQLAQLMMMGQQGLPPPGLNTPLAQQQMARQGLQGLPPGLNTPAIIGGR